VRQPVRFADIDLTVIGRSQMHSPGASQVRHECGILPTLVAGQNQSARPFRIGPLPGQDQIGHNSAECIRLGLRLAGDRARIFELNNLISVKAQGNYVVLHGKNQSEMIRNSIGRVECALKPHGFIRIHRSTLVNAAMVFEIQSRRGGRYSLVTIDGDQCVVSRKYVDNLKLLAAIWLGNVSFISSGVKT